MDFERFDFDYWLGFYSKLFHGDPDSHRTDEGVFKKAVQSHVLAVSDPLTDLVIGSVNIAHNHISHEQARIYMLFGAGRRFRMIWDAYRTIRSTPPFDRTKPLDDEESQAMTRELNSFYVNLRGVLDNLAWSCLFQAAPAIAAELDNESGRRKVGLYTGKFSSIVELNPLHKAIKQHRDWFFLIRDKRDPSAHRIPLAIPTFANSDDAEEWQRLVREAGDGFAKLDFDAIDSAHRRMEKVGEFEPFFVHNPSDGFIPIYPTIPTDVGKLVMIAKSAFDFLRSLNQEQSENAADRA